MKKGFLKKRVTSVALVILVLIILIFAIVHLFGDRALKAGIETAATKTLNVDVKLDDISFSLLGGSVDMQGLVVGNPPDYKHENLLKLESMYIKADIKSFLTDTVKIKQMKFDGMNLVIEQKGLSNNLRDVLNSIPSEPKETDEPKGEGKKLQIDELEISNIKVSVKLLPVPGKADTVTIPLPTIKMKNLGKEREMNIAKLTTKILTKVTASIAEHGKDLPAEITGQFKEALQKHGVKVIEAGKGVLIEGQKIGEGVIEGSKDLGKDVGDAIKGIFGPKK